MRNCGDNRPSVATNRSQVIRFHLIRFNGIQGDLSQEFRGRVVVNGFGWKSSEQAGNPIPLAIPPSVRDIRDLWDSKGRAKIESGFLESGSKRPISMSCRSLERIKCLQSAYFQSTDRWSLLWKNGWNSYQSPNR